MRDHDLSRTRHHHARIEGSILTPTLRPGHHAFREHLAQTTSPTVSSSSCSAVGRRLAAESHCDPRAIRPGCISPADESDQLPRQDREATRCRSDEQELEHNSEGRRNSFPTRVRISWNPRERERASSTRSKKSQKFFRSNNRRARGERRVPSHEHVPVEKWPQLSANGSWIIEDS